MACYRCNQTRGSTDALEFYEERRWLYRRCRRREFGPGKPKIKDIWKR